MKQLRDSVWQRRGISWIWDAEALHQVTASREVLSLRQLMLQRSAWPDELPSNHGQSIVIAGLDACLDLLPPSEAEIWLGGTLKETILSFQDFYGGSDASLVFWLPNGQEIAYLVPAGVGSASGGPTKFQIQAVPVGGGNPRALGDFNHQAECGGGGFDPMEALYYSDAGALFSVRVLSIIVRATRTAQ